MKMVTLQKVKRYNKTMIQFDLAMIIIVCCSGVTLAVVQFSLLVEHYILSHA